MEHQQTGVLEMNGVEVRYMTPSQLIAPKTPLQFVDIYGLLPFIHQLAFDPITKALDPMNVLLSGPKGVGKSLIFNYWAQENQVPYLSLDCSDETRDRQIKGGFIGKPGSTPFVLGTVANAVLVANQVGFAMLVIEELTALTPQRQKELNALTDFRQKIEIPELNWRLGLEPGKVLFVVATMNPSSYGGTYPLNEDLKSRFVAIEVPYPPAATEKSILRSMAPAGMLLTDEDLTALVSIASETRQPGFSYALSTRDLIQILHTAFRTGWENAYFLLVQKFDEEDRILILDRIRDIAMREVWPSLAHRAGLIGR